MRREERYRGIVEYFSEAMPVAQSELDFGSPYELVVAVMLSAQCTDKRVNLTTPALFERFPNAEALAAAGVVTKVNMIFYSVIIGFSVGCEPIMGMFSTAR